MKQYEKTSVPLIETVYESFTPIERSIADFFIHNTEKQNFSARQIASLLYVSEAALSRFAQKCGFKGYREFIFYYEQGLFEKEVFTDNYSKQILNTYQELLNKSYALADELQIERIVKFLEEKKRIYVYGRGSSGLAGQEMRLRFMSIGVNIEAITDSEVMLTNAVLVNEECAVIGISISGKTKEVINSLKAAKQKGAAVILVTSNLEKRYQEFCDEILLTAVKEHLENGRSVSPQFPILVMVDILYAHFMKTDNAHKEELFNYAQALVNGTLG